MICHRADPVVHLLLQNVFHGSNPTDRTSVLNLIKVLESQLVISLYIHKLLLFNLYNIDHSFSYLHLIFENEIKSGYGIV